MRDALPLVSVAARPVLGERGLHPDEEVPAVGRDGGGLEREVLADAVRRARRQERVRAPAGRRGTSRRASSAARTARCRSVAMPSDVTISSPLFVSVRPSGSRLNGAYGSPSGASSVVTPSNATSPSARWPSERSMRSV